MKRTKIVATIGPASEHLKTLASMMRAGLDVCRLNFSHNVHRHHLMLIKNIRAAAKQWDKNVAILQDLQGPRIRIGELPEAGVKVKKGQRLILVYSEKKVFRKSQPVKIPIHYRELYQDLKVGSLVLISDGLIRLQVEKIIGQEIYCQTLIGGIIKTHKGMNFPGSAIKAAPLTAKDLADLEFGVRNGVDFVAISFVRAAKDIYNLRRQILQLEKKFGRLNKKDKIPRTKIVAKIERLEAVKNFDQILKVVDAVMIARGDLGIELPFEDVPMIQKEIIKKCNWAGRPVIVATQMLESMIVNPLPTRAEVSDVANAILDGTDAVMLSGESATGLYPLEAVSAMGRVAKEVEPVEFKLQQDLENKLKRVKTLTDFVAFNAQDVAEKVKAKAIICLTQTGHTARMIARYKSKIPLIAITTDVAVGRQLALSWGISAFQLLWQKNYPAAKGQIVRLLKSKKIIKAGDTVVICAGQPLGLFKSDKLLKIETA
jgi:pyruvate kinase